MKKFIVFSLVAAIMVSSALSASAAESQMRTTFNDAFYGGLAGALVGGAILIFKEDPEDHLDYIGYGFGAGVLVGAAYGLVRSTKALAQIEDGRLAINLPTPRTEVKSFDNRKALIVSADILKYSF